MLKVTDSLGNSCFSGESQPSVSGFNSRRLHHIFLLAFYDSA
jgi:hypothetical protein